MTLLEKVKAAIANPDLITDELIWEAMGKRKIFICAETYEPGEGCQECIPENCSWLQDNPGKRTAEDCDIREESPVPSYLADWNLIMSEMIKRNFYWGRTFDLENGTPDGWSVMIEKIANESYNSHRSLDPARACWAAILADMAEKGEVK